MLTTRLIYLFILFWTFFSTNLPAQSTLERYGKSRVQYKKFNWRNLSTPNFDVYYYDYGKRLSDFAVRYLETEFNNITDVLGGYTPQFKTKIFIYNSISDLQQSNVGYDELNAVIGGQTDFFKSQVEIPFTGSEVDFKKELRRGVAQMLIREMMFGGSLKDMIQNSYLGKFSEWFLLGAAAYTAEGWSIEMDDHLRDLIRTRRLRKPHLLSGRDAILVGQSVWNFIAERYGKANIGHILNYARILRKERSSITNTLGVPYLRFIREWEKYYKVMADEVNEKMEDLPTNATALRKNRLTNKGYNEMKVNPSGTWVAYSENKAGKYKVIIQNLQTKKRKVLLRKGYLGLSQRFDEDIPALSWQDDGKLGVMYIRKGETHLSIFDLKGKKKYQQAWLYFNHVTSFDFSDNGQMLVLSADRKGEHDFKTGQNDLYVYNLQNKANTLQQITDDWFDDIQPIFLPNSTTAIAFSSNRLTDTLTLGLLHDRGNFNKDVNNFDIFIYDPAKSKKQLDRLTDSPARDICPVFMQDKTLLHLSEETGIRQLKKIDLASRQTQNLTTYKQGLRTFDYVQASQGIVYTTGRKGKTLPFYQSNFDFTQLKNTNFQTARTRLLQDRQGTQTQVVKVLPNGFTDTTKTKNNKPKEVFEKDEVDTDNYTFSKEIIKEKIKNPDNTNLPSNTLATNDPLLLAAKKAKQQELKVLGPYAYKPRFRVENAVLSPILSPIRNLGIGIVSNVIASDLLENHKFRGGFLTYFDLNSSSFYGEYQYLPKRYDLTIRFDRTSYQIDGDLVGLRVATNRVTGTFSYPLNNVGRVNISPFYQNVLDEFAFSPLGNINGLPNRVHYGGLKFEAIYDNTTINGQNMMRGTRAKFVWEEYQGLLANEGFKTQRGILGLTSSKMSFRKIVFDARHYQPIHRDLVLAIRVTGGTFGGRSPKNFLLGGMDNWFFGQVGFEDIIAPSQSVADIFFMEFATNLRGFGYNKMSGNSFALANVELRFPIFKYLFGQRVNSNFWKNFQLVGFYDIGSAWTGLSPFENNISPPRIVTNESSPPTIIATVNDFKSPWLVGYGAGVRTVLFGYYLKFDVAWGVEDFITNPKPRAYLTFGYDF